MFVAQSIGADLAQCTSGWTQVSEAEKNNNSPKYIQSSQASPIESNSLHMDEQGNALELKLETKVYQTT
jgi:hypothetical protein